MTGEQRVYVFGPYRLDTRERVLLRDGQPLALTLKAYATLAVLVEHHGHIVDKAELMARVWPDIAVEEGNLTQNVYALRKLLGNRRESGVVIETVPRRGYRLSGQVTLVEDSPTERRAREEAVAGEETLEADNSVEVLLATPSMLPALESARHRYRRRWAWWGIGALLAASTGVLLTTSLATPSATSRAEATSPDTTGAVPLTSLPGDKLHPSLSPDGSQVAFVWNRGDGHQVYVKRVVADADTTLQLTKREGGVSYPVWSPDGRSIAFIRRFIDTDGRGKAGVFVVSSSGGTESRVWLDDRRNGVGNGLDWSSDGRWLVLAVRSELGHPVRLMLLSFPEAERRWVTSPTDGTGDSYPTFSPAGDLVAFIRNDDSETSVRVLNVASGKVSPALFGGRDIRRVAWAADGQTLIFASHQGFNRSLWRVPVKGGDPEPVAGTGEGAGDPFIARRGGRLAFVYVRMDQNLYRAELAGPRKGAVSQFMASNRVDVQPDISPDGSRLAFVSARGGPSEIWVTDADGQVPARITDLRTACANPRWSPDGRFIAFEASASGARMSIYVVDAAGGLSRRLTWEASNDRWPTWSHDGRWIYFMSDRNGTREVWKVPADGGTAAQITSDDGHKAWASRDGRFLYYSNDVPTIWRLPIAGGDPKRLFALPQGTAWGGEWVLSQNGIYWMNEAARRSTIEFFAFADERSTAVFTPPAVFDHGGGFSVSPDGSWIAFGQRDYAASDIMLVNGFR